MQLRTNTTRLFGLFKNNLLYNERRLLASSSSAAAALLLFSSPSASQQQLLQCYNSDEIPNNYRYFVNFFFEL